MFHDKFYVYFITVGQNNTRKRKKNACFYCGKHLKLIGEHLTNIHKSEKSVQKILKSKEYNAKRQKFSQLVAKGNLKYNVGIKNKRTSNRSEQLIPHYKKRNEIQKDGHFLPCIYCRHLYKKKVYLAMYAQWSTKRTNKKENALELWVSLRFRGKRYKI